MAVRKPHANSLTADSARMLGALATVCVPLGCVINSEAELAVWEQYTKARAPKDWRPPDLVALVRVCKLEVRIREVEEALDAEGYTLHNRFGEATENPLLKVQSTLVRQQLAIISSLGLNMDSSRTAGVAVESLRTQAEAEALARAEMGGYSNLLAKAN